MAYRRTANVVRRLAERKAAILRAASELAEAGGMGAIQIVPVAGRADLAAGTVYRYFPSKDDLVAGLIAELAEQEVAAVRAAAAAAPGPLSAMAAVVATFAARALRRRRLTWAVLAEPVEPRAEAARLAFRGALAGEIGNRLRAAIQARLLPDQDVALTAGALTGALLEGLIGPLAPEEGAAPLRDRVQSITLLALRAIGVVDARARGLVVQTALPEAEEARSA